MKNESDFHMAYMSLANKYKTITMKYVPKLFFATQTNKPLIPNLGVGYYLAKIAL